ncbi:MAG: 16S rRNA (uracil(1498)-N(3))-methyltransferase [Betaproteobacteria bacterium]|nr:16S rRNA (uracil(1498)-N(3))-methyltransferase [Betaproteobacteria bacterium]
MKPAGTDPQGLRLASPGAGILGLEASEEVRAIARFFCPQHLSVGQRVALPEQAAHHAGRVLRLKPGDALVLFNGEGGEFEARIDALRKGAVDVLVEKFHARERESALRIVLAQGVSTAEKMDFTLQKAVELGVEAIYPVLTEKGVVRLDEARAARRQVHWQAVVASACEQCGRNRVPRVAPVSALPRFLQELAREPTRLVLSPRAERSLRDLAAPAAGAIFLAGPAGGLSAREERQAIDAGFEAVRLGPRILRTETAAMAALAAAQALWGDF